MKQIIIFLAVLTIISCSSNPKLIVKKDIYEKQNREDKLVQQYIASVMPETTENFVMPLSLSLESQLTEAEITEQIVKIYVEKITSQTIQQNGVAELSIGGINLAAILKGAVEFTIENIIGQKTPQPWNVFYWTGVGKKAWRRDKTITE
jgi:hypothetical protein